jgi:aquaporin Z
VSVGLWAGGRFPAAFLVPYVIAQVAGALLGAGVLYLIASG